MEQHITQKRNFRANKTKPDCARPTVFKKVQACRTPRLPCTLSQKIKQYVILYLNTWVRPFTTRLGSILLSEHLWLKHYIISTWIINTWTIIVWGGDACPKNTIEDGHKCITFYYIFSPFIVCMNRQSYSR